MNSPANTLGSSKFIVSISAFVVNAAKRTNAVKAASRTLNNITGVEVENMTAKVKGGKIVEYKTTVKIAFAVAS